MPNAGADAIPVITSHILAMNLLRLSSTTRRHRIHLQKKTKKKKKDQRSLTSFRLVWILTSFRILESVIAENQSPTTPSGRRGIFLERRVGEITRIRPTCFVSTTTTTTSSSSQIRSLSLHYHQYYSTTAIGMSSKRLDSPAAQRNKQPIWNILFEKVISKTVLPSPSPTTTTTTTSMDSSTTPKPVWRVLEIAAGTGVHTDYFANQWSTLDRGGLEWIPSDPSDESRDSIQAYIEDGNLNDIGVTNPLPLTLDRKGIIESDTAQILSSSNTFLRPLNLMVCINMIHISPWDATLGLFQIANEYLDPIHGYLFCYGPYKENGTAVESNL